MPILVKYFPKIYFNIILLHPCLLCDVLFPNGFFTLAWPYAAIPHSVVIVMKHEIMSTGIHIVILWVMTRYSLIGGFQRFGELYCLHLQGKLKTQPISPL
jgi:hypothetical protein